MFKLIELGANIEAKDNFGQTALTYAAGSDEDEIEIFKVLLMAGADILVQDKYNRTPIAGFDLKSEKSRTVFRDLIEWILENYTNFNEKVVREIQTHLDSFEYDTSEIEILLSKTKDNSQTLGFSQ